MPVLTYPLSIPTADARSILDVEETAVSQGRDGRQVLEQIETVSEHWRQQSFSVLEAFVSDPHDELSSYRHPIFERAGMRRVRYVAIRDLEPRRIECDFDEDTNG